jgi:hypothetical protein
VRNNEQPELEEDVFWQGPDFLKPIIDDPPANLNARNNEQQSNERSVRPQSLSNPNVRNSELSSEPSLSVAVRPQSLSGAIVGIEAISSASVDPRLLGDKLISPSKRKHMKEEDKQKLQRSGSSSSSPPAKASKKRATPWRPVSELFVS